MMYPHLYIIQAPWGDVLQVHRLTALAEGYDTETEDEELWQTLIELYRVDFFEQKLVKLTGIGPHALFVGHNTSTCLPVKDYPELKSNHVYFTDDDRDSGKNHHRYA